MCKRVIIVLSVIIILSSCVFYGLADFKPVFIFRYAVNSGYTDLSYSNGYCYHASGPGGLRVIDVKNPAACREISGFTAIELNETVNAVAVQDEFAYLITNLNLYILDISDPEDIKDVGTVSVVNGGSRITVDFPYAYIRTSAGIDIYDVTNRASPVFAGAFLNSTITDFCVNGEYLYYLYENGSYTFFNALDVSNKTSPVVLGVDRISNGDFLDIYSGYIYIYDIEPETIIYPADLSDPASPVFNSTCKLETTVGTSAGTVFYGESLFLLAKYGLYTLDVSLPEKLQLVEHRFKTCILDSGELYLDNIDFYSMTASTEYLYSFISAGLMITEF